MVLDFKPPIHPPLVGVLDPTLVQARQPAAARQGVGAPAREGKGASVSPTRRSSSSTSLRRSTPLSWCCGRPLPHTRRRRSASPRLAWRRPSAWRPRVHAVPPRDAAPRAPRPPSSVPLTLLGSSPGRASLPRSLAALPCRDPAARPREPPRGEAERQQWDAARPAAAGRRTREAARSGTPLGRRAARQFNRPSVCPHRGAGRHRCCCRLRFRPTPWSSATRDALDEFPFAPSLFSPYPQSPTPQNAGRPVSAAGSHGQELF